MTPLEQWELDNLQETAETVQKTTEGGDVPPLQPGSSSCIFVEDIVRIHTGDPIRVTQTAIRTIEYSDPFGNVVLVPDTNMESQSIIMTVSIMTWWEYAD